MGSPTIFKGSNVKLLKDNIEFQSGQTIISGVATDPTSSATSADAGSILVNTGGNVYVKQDAGSTTNWNILGTPQLGMPIGSVIISALTLAQFQTQNGTGWVLMDGTSCAGTAYATLTTFSLLPDAQGRFLRNYDSVGGTDPDSSDLLVTVEDGIQDHGHKIYAQSGIGPRQGNKPVQTKSGLMAENEGASLSGYVTNGANAESNHMIQGVRTATPNARTNTNETLVKNIIMNHFIRVD